MRLAPTAAGVALGAAAGFNIANVGPAADDLAQAYGVGLAAIGFLTTALFVTHLAMQIPGGRLVDRRGAWILGVWALAAVVAGNVIALLVPSFALGLLGRFVAGFGTGVGFVAGSDYVRATVGTASAQGLYGASGVGGGGLALAVVPLAVPGLGWRAPYVTALVFALAVLAALPLAPRDHRHGTLARGRIADVVHDRRLYPLAVAHSASFGLSVVAGNWAVSLLRDDGYSRGVAGAVAALTLLSGLVTRPLGGRLVERAPRRAGALLGASMLAAAAGTVLLLLSLPLGVRVVGAALLGLAAGIPFAAAFAGAQLFRPDDPGAAVGFVNSCATFVILVGTPLVGLTFALPGEGRAGFAAIAVAFVLAYLPVRRAALPVPA
ncbi:MAG TPA: MFS transporter [Gaiellaceae bacterium]|nr:MFS transporter [Gaiellaceae bacterium]